MNKLHTFTTDSGVEVTIAPISLVTLELSEQGLLQSYKDRGEPLDPPVYEYDLPGGEKQTAKHDETTLRTDEDRAAWKAHIEAKERYERELSELRERIIYLDGVINEPKDDAWEAKQRKRYIRIPEDPDGKRLHWIKTELLKTASDIVEATSSIMELSSSGVVSREQIQAHKRSFLRSLQEPTESRSGATGEAAGETADNQ